MTTKEWKLLIPASTVFMFYLFSPCYAMDLTPTLGDNSAYTIEKSNILDYTFSVPENGSTVYYKINIKTDLTKGNPNLTWAEVSESGDNTVAVNIHHNGELTTKYYKYTYTNIDDTAYVNQNKGSMGGAKQNSTTLENLEGAFVGNYTNVNSENTGSYGGAIYNWATIKETNSNFIGNHANKEDTGRFYTEGGAIYNHGTMDKINGNFIGNYVKSNSEIDNASGGAIFNSVYNDVSIREIEGDFIGNYADGTSEGKGGAITNYNSLDKITGDFIGNYANSEKYSRGGAIYNSGTINEINGNFIQNHTLNGDEIWRATGGAIYTTGTIDKITGNFIGNYIKGEYGGTGGAIGGNVKNITGNFTGNYIEGISKGGQGGAIDGASENIIGDFNENYIKTKNGNAYGGAINAQATGIIQNIKGNFNKNYILTETGNAQGGAIHSYYVNNPTIKNLEGNFTENYAESETGNVEGGAIYKGGTIEKLSGNFEKNHAYSKSGNAFGGAIYYYSDYDEPNQEINSNFTKNYAKSENGNAYGGAISNSGTIQNITGNFTDNYVQSEAGFANGGAISSNEAIENIKSNFSGNYAVSKSGYAEGGAISNSGTIQNITGNFTDNHAQSESGRAKGGAIYSSSHPDTLIEDIKGDFTGNYAKSETENAFGGAIYNDIAINNINGNFSKNYAEGNLTYGGAIYNSGTMKEVNGNFTGNYVYSPDNHTNVYGGAIYNDKNSTIEKLSGNFEGNYAGRSGGAIHNDGTINIIADEKDVLFKNNYIRGTFTKNEDGSFTVTDGIANDIHNGGTLNLNAKSGKKIELNGTIRDYYSPNGTLNIGDTAVDTYQGDVYLKDEVDQKNLNLNSGTLHLGEKVSFNNKINFNLNGGNLDLVNNSIKTYNVNNLNINGNVNMAADVDLQNETMDKISASNVTVANNSYLNVARLNLLSDAENKETNINFTENDKLKNAVRYTGDKKLQGLAPVYKYDVEYDNNTGDFKFIRGNNEYKNINPAAFVAPVAMQTGAYTAQTTTFNKALENVDAFMAMPKKERTALKMQNRYASAKSGDYTIDPNVSQYEKGEIYVNPYTTFEKIPLKNGPKVSNISYGTLIGGDSKFLDLSNGFSAKLGGFITYNGSHQSFDNVGIYQNGGTLGLTGALYKGNFFTGLVLNAGASGGSANTQYGKEDFGIFMTGVASKTGYNFEFADGKFIVQPNYLMSYSYIDAFNYTNSAGSKISPKPLHAIQIEPGLQLIGNFENGWQPYLAASMVFNVLDKTKVYADGFKLPETSIKPYVRYGIGLRKNVKDRYSAFGQAFVTNGGRNGVTLQAGLTAAVGK